MTAILPEDLYEKGAEHELLRYWLEADDPLYRPILSILRRLSTLVGARGVAGRLRSFVRWCRLHELDPLRLTRDDLEDWLASLSGQPVTRATQLSAIHTLYEELLDRDLVTRDPSRRLHVLKTASPYVPALSVERARLVLAGIKRERDDPATALVASRDYLLFLTMLTVGPRAAEMRRLTRSDFLVGDISRLLIFGKGRKSNLVAPPSEVFDALAVYIERLEAVMGRPVEEDDAIAIPLNAPALRELRAGRPQPLRSMSRPALYYVVRERLRDAGIVGTKLGSHRLRATAATVSAIEGQVPVTAVSQMLGHSDPAITWRSYIKPEQQARTAAAMRSPLLDTP